MPLLWSLEPNPSPEDLAVVTEGVFAHGRAQAADGDAQAIACLVRDGTRVVAGGAGRTEYQRLFVHHLWVADALRGQGLGRRILAELEAEAARRGCRDALIETLDDALASLYTRLGYRPVAVVAGYVGRFNRHILIKPGLGAGTGEPDARPPAARGADPCEAPDAPDAPVP